MRGEGSCCVCMWVCEVRVCAVLCVCVCVCERERERERGVFGCRIRYCAYADTSVSMRVFSGKHLWIHWGASNILLFDWLMRDTAVI